MRPGRGILPAIGVIALLAALLLAFNIWDNNHLTPVVLKNTGAKAFTVVHGGGAALNLNHELGQFWQAQPGQEVTVMRARKDRLVIMVIEKGLLPHELLIPRHAERADVCVNADGSVTVSER